MFAVDVNFCTLPIKVTGKPDKTESDIIRLCWGRGGGVGWGGVLNDTIRLQFHLYSDQRGPP